MTAQVDRGQHIPAHLCFLLLWILLFVLLLLSMLPLFILVLVLLLVLLVSFPVAALALLAVRVILSLKNVRKGKKRLCLSAGVNLMRSKYYTGLPRLKNVTQQQQLWRFFCLTAYQGCRSVIRLYDAARHTSINQPANPFIHSFIHSFVRSFVRSFIHSFVAHMSFPRVMYIQI